MVCQGPEPHNRKQKTYRTHCIAAGRLIALQLGAYISSLIAFVGMIYRLIAIVVCIIYNKA